MTESQADPRIVEIAEQLKDFLVMLDIFSAIGPVEELKGVLKRMRESGNHLEAWPFPETMRKGKVMQAQADTLEALINLVDVRKKQLEIQREPDSTPGQDVLKALGF
jgi:hypothetical protein